MTTGAKIIVTFYLVTRVCFTNGILSAKVAQDSSSINVQSSETSNRQSMVGTVSGSTYANQAIDNGVKLIESSKVPAPKIGYLYLNPSAIEFELPLKEASKAPFDRQRYSRPSSYLIGRPASTTSGYSSSSTTMRGEAEVEHRAELSRGSSYQVVEELDEYVTADGDSDHGKIAGQRGKLESSYQAYRNSQELAGAIKALDHFLSGILNGHGYNSPLHQPNNPVLALVLSRYGRYVPPIRKPHLYAYNAVNNIHNNQPFGRYKHECEEEPTYVDR